MLFDGTRDCCSPMMGILFVAPFEDLKGKIQQSFDKYFPIFNSVGNLI